VKTNAPIFVGQLSDGVVWIRVEGKGSFQNSPELKDYVACMVDRGAGHFVVDLENCPVMDSTFMGTLVGIVSKLGDAEGAKLEVINANPRNIQLVQSLGLDQVFALDTDGSTWSGLRRQISAKIGDGSPLDHVELDKQRNTEHVLEAHQNLTEADDSNVPRFRDVIEFLQKELHSTGPA
jgi:anti-anti-sigma factor